MDKQNYTLRKLEKQVLTETFLKLKKECVKALEDRIFQRKRLLKSLDILLTAIALYFMEQLSFQRLSDVMACRYNVVMSDTAWRKQFLKAAPILLEWFQKQQEKENPTVFSEPVLGCSSVYAIDATNPPAQGENSTARRVHTLFSISEHRCVYVDVTDCHGGESLNRFQLCPGALYFADRAYGKTSQLAYVIEQQAHAVIRIAPKQTVFYTTPDCCEKISFSSLLKKESFSTIGYFKQYKKVYYVRLIGAKLPQDKQEFADKRVRQKASRNQYKPSDEAIEHAKWTVLAATLPDSYSDEEILQAYRLRWRIELYFKQVKSLLNFRKLRRSRDAYKDGIVFLWITISFLFSCLQLKALSLTGYSISDFNAFSLVRGFLA